MPKYNQAISIYFIVYFISLICIWTEPAIAFTSSHRFDTTKTYVKLHTIPWEPAIQTLVDAVSTDSIAATILRLQRFYSRPALSCSSYAASQWLCDKLNSYAVASFDSFYIPSPPDPDSGYERNVVARKSGSVNPDIEYIVCGHFDGVGPANEYRPAADDNASGTAMAVEAARVLRYTGMKQTLDFICLANEEGATRGSRHYARTADSLDQCIWGVINFDMVGYRNDTIADIWGGGTTWLQSLFDTVAALYAPSLRIYRQGNNKQDDQSFRDFNYPAVGYAEYDQLNNPYLHTAFDTLGTLDSSIYTNVARVCVATMAILGSHPDMLRDLNLTDVGTGHELYLSWAPSLDPNVAGYNIYYGKAACGFTDSISMAGISIGSCIIEGLQEDTTYHFIARAVDKQGRRSYLAEQVSGIPMSAPRATILKAMPVPAGVRLDWRKNDERDFAGYRIYRRINDAAQYDSINIALIGDTTYLDAGLSGASRYYYRGRGFDSTGHGSEISDSAYCRPLTLDQGILVVDETYNGTAAGWPSDSAQDSFYAHILLGYQFTDYEYDSPDERPVFADFAPYSTILWHGDDYSSPMASVCIVDLKAYLEAGGRLWFVGWRPTANIRSGTTYPASFADSCFIREYFKASGVALTSTSDSFQGTHGILGYPDVPVDPTKVPLASWGGTMRFVEAYQLASGAEEIYRIDLRNSGSPFEGQPCGVRYLGPSYRTALFGFPFYFMDIQQARAAAVRLLSDLGETSVAAEPLAQPQPTTLDCYPNPFHSFTTMRVTIKEPGMVELKVYNVAGQRINSIMDAYNGSGPHLFTWNGKNERGARVSAGVYICVLQTKNDILRKTLICIR